MPKVTFAATGDSLITRRLPHNAPGVSPLRAVIEQADVRFTNLEVVVRTSGEGFPAAQSGGTWATTTPETLDCLKAYGFNVVNWANNHTLDYSYGGLTATARYIDQLGLVRVGAGENLADAAAAGFVETPEARVACLGVTCTFHESWIAGQQRPDMSGRPGVNPLRYQTIYHVHPQRLAQLQAIAQTCDINAAHNLSVKEGFTPADPPDVFRFGKHLFKAAPDGVDRCVTTPHEADLKRLCSAIAHARLRADQVMVSVHAHEMKGTQKDQPADFLIQAARGCIDAGADAVVGHGPHILRGIEIYKSRPIFYSLGNFIFQNETVHRLPADFFSKYGLGPSHDPAEALHTRSNGGRRGLSVNPKAWSSVVACWEMQHHELTSLTLHPISLDYHAPAYRQGWPSLTDDVSILEQLQCLSEPLGTRLIIRDGVACLPL